jgi:hypothetical protein
VKNLQYRLLWFPRPWRDIVNVKETLIEARRAEIKGWLDEHAQCGWRSVGYVKPKTEELVYIMGPPRVDAQGIIHPGERQPVPHAFIGIQFKNPTEAVIFKMILNDFE